MLYPKPSSRTRESLVLVRFFGRRTLQRDMTVPIDPTATVLPDAELLEAYVQRHEADALAELVRRNLPFVYGCAVRQVRDDVHLAEDVAQAVFILLATRGARIRLSRPGATLQSWLFITTRFAAANALKMRARRRYHERHAAKRRAAAHDPTTRDDPWPSMAPLLDEAIARLSETDRSGVLLRFFSNKTFRQVGAALGMSEEAARKRVRRAVGKMRSFFASRGVAVSGGALMTALAVNAPIAVTPALALSVINSTLAATLTTGALGTTGSSAAYAIAKGALSMFQVARIKLVSAACAVTLAVGVAGAAMVTSAFSLVAWQDPKAPSRAASVTTFIARFDDGLAVEFLGIQKLGARDDKWWYPDGSASPERCDPPGGSNEPPHTHLLLFRVTADNAPAVGISFSIDPKSNWSSDEATRNGARIEGGHCVTIRAEGESADVSVLLAPGQWESVVTCEQLDATHASAGKHGGVIFSPTIDAPNPLAGNQPGALVTVSHSVTDYEYRVIGHDANGVEHVARPGNSCIAGAVRQGIYYFDQTVDELRTISFQVRPYDHTATFANLTLDPDKPSKVRITALKK
jgi:RNA polymerase sigma factor (sigma-70 family)